MTFCAGHSLITGEFPAQSQWRGALMGFFICAWTNSWENNGDAGDLRRHLACYDFIVMTFKASDQYNIFFRYLFNIVDMKWHRRQIWTQMI